MKASGDSQLVAMKMLWRLERRGLLGNTPRSSPAPGQLIKRDDECEE